MKKNALLKKTGIIILIIAVLVTGFICAEKFYVPKFHLPENISIPDEHKEAILGVERGRYNKNLPIFAYKIEVLKADESSILYKVYYFPFGDIERSYSREAGGDWIFDLKKPISGLA